MRPLPAGRTRWHRTIPSLYSAHAARDGNAFEHNQGGQPMAQDLSTSITRRSVVAGLALSAAPVALAGADNAWVCNVSGGPFQFMATKPSTPPLGLEEAHRDLRISPADFDEVAAELGRTYPTLRQGPETREGRSPGSLCRSQGRGHGRLRRGCQARLKLLYCPVQTIPLSQSWAVSVAAPRRDDRIKLRAAGATSLYLAPLRHARLS
jgi:hypothetical protein